MNMNQTILSKANNEFRNANYEGALKLYKKGLTSTSTSNQLKSIFATNIKLCKLMLNDGSNPVSTEVFQQYLSEMLAIYPEMKNQEKRISDNAKKIKSSESSPLVSVVMPTWNRADIIREAIQSLVEQSYQNWELLVCDDGSDDNTAEVVEYFHDSRIHYFLLEKNNGAVARNHGIKKATGEIVAFLDSDNIWHPEYLSCVVNAHNQKKSPIVYTGFYDTQVENDVIIESDVKFRKFDFQKLAWRNYIDMNTLSMRKSVLDEIGGFDPKLERLQDWDLITRSAEKYTFYGLDLPLVLYRRNKDWNQVTETKKHLDLRTVVLNKNTKLRENYNADQANKNNVDFFGTLDSLKLLELKKIAIKISAPSEDVAHSWGDYHFAHQLGQALYKFGWDYEVHCQDQWYKQGCDVNIALRGRHRFITEKSNAKINLLWIISHPDRLADGELDDYDHIFVASEVFIDKLRKATQVPSSVLHQATDPSVFKPAEQKLNLPTPLVFIGNSRKEYRTMVKWSVEKKLPLSVWGGNWEEFINKKMVVAEYIPNNEVANYYSSCEILLNDHWDSMRNNGFISNRLFDASAAGSFIISDDVKGLSKVFGDCVAIANSADELEKLVKEYTSNAELRHKKSVKAREIVLKNHTFLHRADSVSEILNALASKR